MVRTYRKFWTISTKKDMWKTEHKKLTIKYVNLDLETNMLKHIDAHIQKLILQSHAHFYTSHTCSVLFPTNEISTKVLLSAEYFFNL